MSDFSAAGLFWGVVILVIFTSLSVGHEVGKQSIAKQCNNFSSMSINDNLYQCKLIKNNLK